MGKFIPVKMTDLQRIGMRYDLRTDTDQLTAVYQHNGASPSYYIIAEHFRIGEGGRVRLYREGSAWNDTEIDEDDPLVALYDVQWDSMHALKQAVAVVTSSVVKSKCERIAYVSNDVNEHRIYRESKRGVFKSTHPWTFTTRATDNGFYHGGDRTPTRAAALHSLNEFLRKDQYPPWRYRLHRVVRKLQPVR